MASSLAITALVVWLGAYSSGEYINWGLQSMYPALAALLSANLVCGTLALRWGLGMSVSRSFVLALGWNIAFAGSLVIALVIVQIVLVDWRRG